MAAAKKETEAEAPLTHVLPRKKLVGGDFARKTHSVNVPSGTPAAAIRRPEYWSLVAGQLRTKDKIECFWEDGTRYAELLVRFSGLNTAIVTVIHEIELDGAIEIRDESLHEVTFRGDGWVVIRKSDGKVVAEALGTREAALLWAAEQEKALAR